MSSDNLPSLAPRTFEDAIKFSEILAKSDFVPRDFRGKPGDILAAIQMGYEVGLSPMAALSNIAVINGRPSIWGDALLGIVQASGLLEWIRESDDGETATCAVKRKNDPEVRTTTFSIADARIASLALKDVWKNYPKRMRQMRARNLALRDKFPDRLKGLIAREEAIDISPIPNPGELAADEVPQTKVEVIHDIPPEQIIPKGEDGTNKEKSMDDETGTAPAEDFSQEEVIDESPTRTLTPMEIMAAKEMFKRARGTPADKMAKLQAVIPGFKLMSMNYSQLETFARALSQE